MITKRGPVRFPIRSRTTLGVPFGQHPALSTRRRQPLLAQKRSSNKPQLFVCANGRRTSPSCRSCWAKPKIIATQRLSVGIVRKADQGRKTGAAFRAMPNVTRVVVAPILGPHRRNQVSTALNATHHVNLLTATQCRAVAYFYR